LICEPEELLAEGDAESSMAPRIVIWEANYNPAKLGLPSLTLALQFNGLIDWKTKSTIMRNEFGIKKKNVVHFQPKVRGTHKILHVRTFVKPINVKIAMKMQIT
jgi:hypothetical protein